MIRSLLFCITLLVLLQQSVVAAPKPDDEALEQTSIQLQNALKAKDLKAARGFFATVKDYSEADLQEEVKNLSDSVAKEALKIGPGAKTLRDCGVVRVSRKDDVFPFYAVKQDGKWKLLPEFPNYQSRKNALTDEQKESFEFLKGWFENWVKK